MIIFLRKLLIKSLNGIEPWFMLCACGLLLRPWLWAFALCVLGWMSGWLECFAVKLLN